MNVRFGSESPGPDLGQTPKVGGPSWARAWAKSGPQICKSLYFMSKNGLCHKINSKISINSLISFTESPLQQELRQVCANGPRFGAAWASSGPLLQRSIRLASPSGWVFGMALAALIANSPALAEGWQRASLSTEWSDADRFSAEAFRRNETSTRRSFETFLNSLQGDELNKLMDLISRAESPHLGYDSVQKLARVQPPKRPSQMTLGGIFHWIHRTPGQHHAIGRYQVIPKTLAFVSGELGLEASTRFDRRTQDRIAAFLIREAGYEDFRARRLTRHVFMDNLAHVWAGLPLANGRSAYHGIAGNKATLSRYEYESAMAAIFPTPSTAK